MSIPAFFSWRQANSDFSVFSVVRNDMVSRPLTKGMLDGNLFANFEHLPVGRQVEMSRPLGVDRLAAIRERKELSGPW